MTTGIARPVSDAAPDREPGRARLVLDGEFALDEVVATLLRAELTTGVTVDVVLVTPRLSWSTDAAQVSTVQRRRWRRASTPRDRTTPSHQSIYQEGPRR